MKLKELLLLFAGEDFKYAIDNEKYYFTTREYVGQRGVPRVRRTTDAGHWKTSSKDEEIKDENNKKIGYIKKFKFFEGKSKKATNWIMHEFRDLDAVRDGYSYISW